MKLAHAACATGHSPAGAFAARLPSRPDTPILNVIAEQSDQFAGRGSRTAIAAEGRSAAHHTDRLSP